MEYLYIVQQALVWILTIFWLYQLMISICSLVKLKEKPLLIDKKHKFMAIIPAHNEEAVVGNLVESLKNQDYPKDLYDIYVIADNCTDNTAQVAREKGAIVYERFDSEKKTKGYALQWFLQQKIQENAPYDAFFVFDADNIVDKGFIKAMNKKLCQGEDVVQGYRDIKNPTDSWVTAGYAIFYWTIQSIAKIIFSIIDFPKIIANIILMIDTVNKFEDNPPRIMLLIILLFLFFIFITVSSTKTIVAKIPSIIPRIS